jgi:quercetin dioxygenase-like cupin family protein
VNVQPEFATVRSGLDAGRAGAPPPAPAAPAQVLDALHQPWSEIPAERLEDGTLRQMVVARDVMVCRLRFPPGVETPAHSHPHEQITLVEKGRARFTFGKEERLARAGDVLFFPGGFWHGVQILDEETVLIDIFTPIREDLLKRDSSRG